MRKQSVVICAAVAAVLCGTLCATAQEQAPAPVAKAPAPKIVCDTPVYQFGEMDNTRDVEHVFILRNTGELSLEITAVRATCGCTATEMSTKIIPPGGQAELKAKLTLRGRQGRQRKAIMIHSNDPETPMLSLYFDGTAVTGMDVRPRQVFFGRVTSDAVATGIVEVVMSRSEKPTRVTKVSAGSPLLAAEHTPASEGAPDRIVITTVPPLPKGTFRGSVRVESDHPQYPSVDVVVSGFVVSDVTFAPQELILPEQPEVAVTRYILVRSESDRAFQVTSIDVPQPEIEAIVQQTAPTAYRIEVRNIKASGDLNGKAIRVNTTLQETPQFSIPIRIVPRG